MIDIKKITDQRHLILDTAISLAIVAVVFYFIGVDAIVREFSHLNYLYLLVSAGFLVLMYVGMTARLHLVLSELGVKLRFRDIFKVHVMGMLLADFTPARAGYFAVAYGLTKKYKVPEEKSMIAVLGPQIYDFMLKVVVGTAGLFYLLNTYLKISHSEILFLGALVMAGMIAVMVLLLFSKRFLAFFSFTRRIAFADKVLSIFEKAQQNSKVILHHFPSLFFLLMFTWSMKAISWFFVAKALGITLFVDFPEVFAYFFLQPLLTLLEFIPSPTLAGLGLSEGGGVLIFSLFGIGAAKAASFVFLARVKTIIVNLPAVKEAVEVLKS
ncbi:Lysylphosphatidylglycerol synthase TM region [uncultured archaeon]|nr:Lysylphosphatidylglycerol synthase TM region [uncultured archaeon]